MAVRLNANSPQSTPQAPDQKHNLSSSSQFNKNNMVVLPPNEIIVLFPPQFVKNGSPLNMFTPIQRKKMLILLTVLQKMY